MRLPGVKVQKCMLSDVLHVPDLSYNLVCVSKASEKVKVTEKNRSPTKAVEQKTPFEALHGKKPDVCLGVCVLCPYCQG